MLGAPVHWIQELCTASAPVHQNGALRLCNTFGKQHRTHSLQQPEIAGMSNALPLYDEVDLFTVH